MIPLIWFLFGWLALMAIFAVASLITVITNVRFGLSSFATYLTTALFLAVSILVILFTVGYLATVNWNDDLRINSGVDSSLLQ